jgi:type IV pilus assembly protein PilA
MSLAKKLKASRGFTLVELMIVVVIIGILAALAIYGVRQYVTNAKTAEARLALGRLSKDASSAFEGERMAGALLALGGTVGTSRRLCLSAANAVPAALQAAGVKYQPQASDWTGNQTTGWQCLNYQMDAPILFQYDYQSNQTATGAPVGGTTGFTVSGQADMGGNFKLLSISGLVQGSGANVTLTVSPSILEEDLTAAVTNPQRWSGGAAASSGGGT